MRPPLPDERKSVLTDVQVSVEADVTQGHWVGRVEHVVSGEAEHFQTLDDFLGFMIRVLTDGSPEPPGIPRGP